MHVEKHVVIVDRPNGTLADVRNQLADPGFRVLCVPTLGAALEIVESKPKLSLIVASAAAVDEDGDHFLSRIKELEPSVPIVWGVRADGSADRLGKPGPDRTLQEPFAAADLERAALRLLSAHFYPRAVSDAVHVAACEAFEPFGGFKIIGNAYLKANQTNLSELNAFITFAGDASGHLLVGMTRDHAQALYRRMFPGSGGPTIDRAEDLTAELCNVLLGRIKVSLESYGLSVTHTTPIIIRSTGAQMRYPRRQPSLAAEFGNGEANVLLEYYLDGLAPDKLERSIPTDIVGRGEIHYF